MNTINILMLSVLVAIIPGMVTARHLLVKVDGAKVNDLSTFRAVARNARAQYVQDCNEIIFQNGGFRPNTGAGPGLPGLGPGGPGGAGGPAQGVQVIAGPNTKKYYDCTLRNARLNQQKIRQLQVKVRRLTNSVKRLNKSKANPKGNDRESSEFY